MEYLVNNRSFLTTGCVSKYYAGKKARHKRAHMYDSMCVLTSRTGKTSPGREKPQQQLPLEAERQGLAWKGDEGIF